MKSQMAHKSSQSRIYECKLKGKENEESRNMEWKEDERNEDREQRSRLYIM